MFCEKCGAELVDGSLFCAVCGQPININGSNTEESVNVINVGSVADADMTENAQPICANCGSPIEKGMKFCNTCGMPVQNQNEDDRVLVEDSNEGYKKERWKFTRVCIIIAASAGGVLGICWLLDYLRVFHVHGGFWERFLEVLLGSVHPGIAIVSFLIFIISLFPNIFIKRFRMTVSKNHVSKIFKDGRRIDIPMDTITLTKATEHFNGILVYGRQRCKFTRLSNRDYVYGVINQCLKERQEALQRAKEQEAKERAALAAEEAKRLAEKEKEEAAYRENVLQGLSAVQNASGADEIVKYKNLLDQGIITEEEFNAKKKQLLGL